MFVAGPYSATYNGHTIGMTENGFNIRETVHEEVINTNDGGQTPIDAIQMGNDTIVEIDNYVEYDKIKAAIYSQIVQGQPLANVGKLVSSLSAVLVLTPMLTTTPPMSTYTFTLASVNGDIRTLLSSHLRKGPITFRVLPDPDISNKTYTVS